MRVPPQPINSHHATACMHACTHLAFKGLKYNIMKWDRLRKKWTYNVYIIKFPHVTRALKCICYLKNQTLTDGYSDSQCVRSNVRTFQTSRIYMLMWNLEKTSVHPFGPFRGNNPDSVLPRSAAIDPVWTITANHTRSFRSRSRTIDDRSKFTVTGKS